MRIIDQTRKLGRYSVCSSIREGMDLLRCAETQISKQSSKPSWVRRLGVAVGFNDFHEVFLRRIQSDISQMG